ncbi:MAG: site-specific integrase [Bacteroidetes bacterium]|nr:site-specific integrase [Bacteroidota bacterium]
MASVKVKFLEDKVLKDGTHPIAVQVLHARKKKLFYIGHSLKKSDWDFKNNNPNTKHPNYRLMRARIKTAYNDLEAIILDFENTQDEFTLVDVAAKYKPELVNDNSAVTFNSFVDKIITEMKKENRSGNADAYNKTKCTFENIYGDNILITDIDETFVKDFIHKMTLNKLSVNSRGFHLRELRATVNRAIKEGIYDEAYYPFKNISIKTQKTRKRAVNKEVIKMVEELDVSKETNLQFYKDLFMFSFYNRGMNFVDIAFLKVKNIESGRINYYRQKTGQRFSIKITDKSKTILDRYSKLKDPESYIFPIIYRKSKEYLDYRNAMRLMNKKLKKISTILELDVPLTTYVTRHSWATIAKKSGISTAIISEGLGHESEETTQVYLDSFENDVLDDANELIIN